MHCWTRLQPKYQDKTGYGLYADGMAELDDHVGVLLRKMTQDRALLNDAAVDGFTIILEWLKQDARGAGDRPIHETIAIFIPRRQALEFLGARVDVAGLSQRLHVRGFDGETALGELRLNGWEDNFAATYKVANYQVAQGVTCR